MTGEVLVYVSVSNTDQRLTMQEWAEFAAEVAATLRDYAGSLFLDWYSPPASARQGAVWAVKMDAAHRLPLRERLDRLRVKYRQDEVAWADGAEDFIR